MPSANDDDIQSKIEDIQKRVEEARPKDTPDEMLRKKDLEENEEESRAGSEFLGNVIAGGILGYGVDWAFDTAPWGMIFFILIGFISGVYRANAAMKEEYEKKDDENTK